MEPSLTDGAPPRTWTVFLSYILVFVALLVAGMAVVIVFLGMEVAGGGLSSRDPEKLAAAAMEFATSPESLVLNSLISSTVFILVPMGAVFLGRSTAGRRLRVRRAPVVWTGVFVIGLLCLSTSIDSAFALLGWSDLGTIGMVTRGIEDASGVTIVLAVITIGLGAGIGEELFFRGFMQTRLRERWGPWPAIGVTAAAFGLVHLDPFHVTFAFVVGLALGWITEVTGSIVPAVAAHMINNSLWVVLAWALPEPLPVPVHGMLLVLSLTMGMTAMVAIRLAHPAGAQGSAARALAQGVDKC